MQGPKPSLRIAIAGSGAMARYHAERFGGFPDVSIAGCYDRDRSNARMLAERCEIAHSSDDIEQLLDSLKPDALSVAAADAEQYRIVSAALKRGVPVFAEKPFTTSVEQARRLLQLQRRYRTPVMLNYSKVNYPAIYGLLRAVQAGRIGEVYEIELAYLQSWMVSDIWGTWWRTPRWLWRISSSHGGGGALRDLGSHLLYLALCLGGEVRRIHRETEATTDRSPARASGYSCDMNDTFTLELTFTNGSTARVRGSYADPSSTNTVLAGVRGSRARAEVVAERDKSTLRFTDLVDGYPQTVRFAKVYSTYWAFITALRNGTRWDAVKPSIETGVQVHELLSED